MLTTTLLALLAAVIAVLVVLIIYLADRFNSLERETRQAMANLQQQQVQSRPPSGPYAGLSGKALWDAVTGQAEGGLDELTLDGVRKRYRLLLGEHIGHVFNEGANDQRRGVDSAPGSTRMIRTPKTQVESWLPPEAVGEIYRCGQGQARGDEGELPALRQRLDEVCASLHQQAGLEVLQSASSVLMPPPAPGAPSDSTAVAVTQ